MQISVYRSLFYRNRKRKKQQRGRAERITEKRLNQQGFTLPEILVVLCLLSLLMPFLLQCFFTISQQQTQRAALLELEDNLLLATDLLARDIASSTAVLNCEENQLTLQHQQVIYYDLGRDQQAAEHFYPIEGEILYRREHTQKNRQPMANFISSLTFFYLDAEGQYTDEAEAVRSVGFSIMGEWHGKQIQQKQIVRLAGSKYL